MDHGSGKSMTIIVNTASTFKGGSVQVAVSFIESCRKFPRHTYHVVLSEALYRLIRVESFPSNFCFYRIGFRPATRVFSLRSHSRFLEDLEARVRPDCVFTTSGPAYWRPRAKHLMGFNLGHYIYRDSPFFRSLSWSRNLYWRLKGAVIKYFISRDADAYVVQTDDVNERLRRWIRSDRVYTVTNTYSSYFEQARGLLPSTSDRLGDEFRLLMLSAWYSHKNFGIVRKIIALFRKRGVNGVRFVLTLPNGVFENFFLQEEREYIDNVGPVMPNECPKLYQDCDAVFLPSLLECFSANYVEGMVMRKPILTSDLSFARTVCGEAALYFDPLDAEDVASKIEALRASRSLQRRLVVLGAERLQVFLNAEERASKYLQLCRDLVCGQ